MKKTGGKKCGHLRRTNANTTKTTATNISTVPHPFGGWTTANLTGTMPTFAETGSDLVAVAVAATVFVGLAAGGAAATTSVGAAAIGAGAAAAGAAATAAGAGATVAGATSPVAGAAATSAAASAGAAVSGAVGAVIAAGALLTKYGLMPRKLDQTNILTPETEEDRLLSEEVLQVKDAPDMSLMETVMHFTSLLCEESCVEDSLHNDDDIQTSASISSSNTSLTMPENARDSDASRRRVDSISEIDRKRVVSKAKRCLEWAQDPERPAVPGAEQMTQDQVWPWFVSLLHYEVYTVHVHSTAKK